MENIIKVEDNFGARIDVYLIDKTEYTRTKIKNMINKELITVNGKVVKPHYLVSENDSINIEEEINEVTIEKEKMDLDIIYEDDDMLIINKKSGIVVHPAIGNYSNTLVNGLMYHLDIEVTDDNIRPGIVHRIDKDTSGLLVVSKNDKAHLNLQTQIKDKICKRKYIALVHGNINHDTGTIDAPIGRDITDRKKMMVTDINSKHSITHFRVLESYKNTTLIECELDTGRTHQIRVHMKYIGHPIVNDSVYGRKKTINEFGQMLHAKELSLYHPSTGKLMTFTCELPSEFNEIVEIYKNED